MKKLVIGSVLAVAFGVGPALAADQPIAARPYAAAAAWNWTGFYFGGHTGDGFGEKDWRRADGFFAASTPFDGKSVIGGGFSGAQVGYNWQTGDWVWGAELSGSLADIHGFTRCDIALFICNTKVEWFGTATGRLGYAFDHMLLYGKGGVAVIHDKENMQTPFVFPVAHFPIFNGSTTRAGWTLGAGLEYAFTPAWSVFAEYDYADFGTKSVHMTDQFGDPSNVGIRQNLNLIKFGLNYRLGAGGAFPPAPRYTKAPVLSEWTMEAGTRYWFSDGKMVKDLYDPVVTHQLNSRLTYGPENGHSLEGFFRFDHRSGLFLKGFLGMGILQGGTLADEDFPPAIAVYSKTDSQMKEGRLRYGAVDVGDAIFRGANWNLGPFVGYRQYYQVSNGFGCTQVATNPAVCVPTIPTSVLGLTETETWRGVAVGLNGEIGLWDRLKLVVDAAYLPYVNMSGFDNHWLRADINPQRENGNGWGTQIEALLNYALTDRWSVGIGGRYWHFETRHAETEFPGVGPNSPMRFTTTRVGVFAQTSYKFNGSDLVDPAPLAGVFKAPARTAAVNWSGFYVGGHAGGGWGVSDWKTATGTLGTAPVFPGTSDVNGLLAGGQLGYRVQAADWIYGVEVDASWADFVGTAKCATFNVIIPTSATCHTNIDSLGTVTATLGKSEGKFLFYGKAGGAWANEKDAATSITVVPNLNFGGSQTRFGWTIGSGIAYALTNNWSVFAEYDYLGFGNKAINLSDPANGTSQVHIDQHLSVMKVGANYRFDWSEAWGKGPVTAKY
jgi:opacity protein-like surface antigen